MDHFQKLATRVQFNIVSLNLCKEYLNKARCKTTFSLHIKN